MLFSYKFFIFSQLPNKFYNRKFQNIHLTQPKIKIKTFIHNIYMIYSMRRGGKSERLTVGLRDWLRQRWIGDVGGGYGFTGVRESDSWAEVCGSEVRWGRWTQIELKQWRKLTGTEACGSVALVGLWVELGLAWGRGWSSLPLSCWWMVTTELGESVWCLWVRVRSVWGLCEKCKTIEGKIRTKMVLWVRGEFFTVNV